jgi:hypothetical protein
MKTAVVVFVAEGLLIVQHVLVFLGTSPKKLRPRMRENIHTHNSSWLLYSVQEDRASQPAHRAVQFDA